MELCCWEVERGSERGCFYKPQTLASCSRFLGNGVPIFGYNFSSLLSFMIRLPWLLWCNLWGFLLGCSKTSIWVKLGLPLFQDPYSFYLTTLTYEFAGLVLILFLVVPWQVDVEVLFWHLSGLQDREGCERGRRFTYHFFFCLLSPLINPSF